MNIDYTEHATEKMAERDISKKVVERALREPDKVLNTEFGRKIAHKLIKDRLLRVVYIQENDNYTVITAYYTYPERYEVEEH